MALQTFRRSLQFHRILLGCPHVNTLVQKRNLKFPSDLMNLANWAYHDYKFTFQEIIAYQNKTQLAGLKEYQKYSEEKLTQLGPDLACAEIVLLLGGKVKFLDDDIWYKKFKNMSLPTPRVYDESFKIEGIDASNIILLYDTLNYLSNLEFIRYICLSMSKYVDDWYIEKLVELCPDIEALDISDCPNITDNGLEMLRHFKNLKVVNVTNCHKIKCGEAVCAHLEDFCPSLNVIGLESLRQFKTIEEFQEYEQKSSRYLNWGYIMNERLGLNNDINFDEFFKSQMDKVLNDSEGLQAWDKECEGGNDKTVQDKEDKKPGTNKEKPECATG